MRNHSFLYLLRSNGETGEFEPIAESNSAFPVLWRILLAQPASIEAADVTRMLGRVRCYFAADARAGLQRYERVMQWFLQQPTVASIPDVSRYLQAVQRYLDGAIATCTWPAEPAPLFLVSVDEFASPAALEQQRSVQWWREFQAMEASECADALESLLGFSEAKLRIADWRAWSGVFGFALFVQPYFAESFRQPLAHAYEAGDDEGGGGDDDSEEVWPWVHGAAVVLRHDRYGYLDAQGKVLVAPQFDEADDFTAAGVARVGKQRRYGLLRADGSYALPLDYEQLDWSAALGGWLCRRERACTLVHADASAWISTAWDAIEVLVPARLLKVRRDGKVGALDWSGTPAVPCVYTSLSVSPSQHLLARKAARMGIIDAQGNERLPFEFSAIEPLEPHVEGTTVLAPPELLRVHSLPERSRPKAGVWQLDTAQWVVPCSYDRVWLLQRDEAHHGFLVANRTTHGEANPQGRYSVGVLRSDGSVLAPVEYAWIGVRADFGKTGAMERVRESIFDAWSRGHSVEACLHSSERVWLSAEGVRASAPDIDTLRAPAVPPLPMPTVIAAAFYKFVSLPDFKQLREPLLAHCESLGVKGTILLAEEGINGTIAGAAAGVRAVLAYLRADARFADLAHKESPAQDTPFYRMKVRLKREIVTMGVPEVNPARMAGTYVAPEQWNALLDDPDLVLIDARNDYEVALGTFEGALNPKTRSFRELPGWLREQAALKNKPKVAMFCTGGIRCEKSTAFLRSEGFEQVYHLQGGILKYLETVPESQSRWQGECFVFDERVAIGHALKPGQYELCRSCREPVGATDKSSAFYVPGVSCPKCYHTRSEEKKRGLLERHRQVELAKRRNDAHIGVPQELKKKLKR